VNETSVATHSPPRTKDTAMTSARRRYVPRLIAFGTGALLTCSFAPLQWWPLAILCPAVLMYLWEGVAPREAAWRGFWFTFGTFLFGVYWIYYGLHDKGDVPAWIALALVFALSFIMGLYHALLAYSIARWLPAKGLLRSVVGIPAAWVFVEWWRGWFLSGFSWLSLGYTQTDTWLSSLAPVIGVYGLSALLLVSAGALVALLRGTKRDRIVAAAVLIVPWIIALPLRRIEWTQPAGPAVHVAIAQGNIPQNEKWLLSNRDATLDIYRKMAESAFGTPVIVFPESSLPDVADQFADYLKQLYRDASRQDSSVVLGVLRRDEHENYYNSVLSLGQKVQWYDKDHLVPFAEFFPVPSFVRSWLKVMSLPYSDFTRGGVNQPPLEAGGLKLAASICYEDGYGSAQLPVLKEADALVNVTNDAWFGKGSARYQHFQIARMRALESQRFMLRAANDGISAVIGPHGEVVAVAPEFQRFVLRSEVTPRAGLPPYARVGNWFVILLASAGVLLAALRRRAAKA